MSIMGIGDWRLGIGPNPHYEIYFHLINKKYNINKVLNKDFYHMNLKEKDKKTKSGTSAL